MRQRDGSAEALWSTIVPPCSHTSRSVEWTSSSLTEEDREHLNKEGLEASPFDPFHLRASMYTNKRVKVVVKECALAKVIVLHIEARDPTPWALWGRMLQAMGAPVHGSKWRIVWFAHPKLRVAAAEPPGPGNINGGYTFPCTHDTIILYRKEEASRVLLHELLHASCTDDPSLPLEERESRTEAWAEVFLIAILAKGSVKEAARLWAIQADYIVKQHHALQTNHGVRTSADYVWRYTLGREDQFRRLGLALPSRSHVGADKETSLRLTSPRLMAI